MGEDRIAAFIKELREKGIVLVTWRSYYYSDESHMDSVVYTHTNGYETEGDTWEKEMVLWELQSEVDPVEDGEFVLNVDTLEVSKVKELWMPEPEIEEEALPVPLTKTLTVPGIRKRKSKV